jgi:hypothetical protein
LRSSLGIFAPTAHRYRRTSLKWYEFYNTHHEHLQGLFTLLAFLILQPLRPYFMPKVLMGFPSQSFVPDSNLKILLDFNCSFAFCLPNSIAGFKNPARIGISAVKP